MWRPILVVEVKKSLLNRQLTLILLFPNLLAIALASQRFFHTLLLAWFQIERVTLDLFDNVFGLDFALETAQGIFERFTFLNSNLCQGKYTSQSGPEWLFIHDTPSCATL